MIKILSVLLISALINISTANMIEKNYSEIIERSVKSYPYLNSKGRKATISPALVKAIIYQESRGNPEAKSKAGAYGLTQIMPATAKLLKCDYKKLNNPKHSIDCSVKFLAALLTYNKGDLIKTLSGYNGGTWSTERKPTSKKGKLAGRIYDNPETKKYVVSVLRWFEWFRKNSKSVSVNHRDSFSLR